MNRSGHLPLSKTMQSRRSRVSKVQPSSSTRYSLTRARARAVQLYLCITGTRDSGQPCRERARRNSVRRQKYYAARHTYPSACRVCTPIVQRTRGMPLCGLSLSRASMNTVMYAAFRHIRDDGARGGEGKDARCADRRVELAARRLEMSQGYILSESGARGERDRLSRGHAGRGERLGKVFERMVCWGELCERFCLEIVLIRCFWQRIETSVAG